MRTLRHADLRPRHAGCHIARSFYHQSRASGMHGHDFVEAMWVEVGTVRHDDVRGTRLLTAGDLLLVRAGHQHDIRGIPGTSAVIVNVAVPAKHLAELERRYAAAGLWGAEATPRVVRLGPEDIAQLSHRAEALRLAPDDALARDAFLLDLLDRLRPRAGGLWQGAPPWLDEALTRCIEPPLLADGLAGLVRLTGRSREYISRTLRDRCGRTPTEVFTELRLRWAERRLALADDPVADIATACGIGRVRLHRLFTATYGRGPRAYRAGCRRPVG